MIHGFAAGIALLQNRVNGDFSIHIGELHDGHIDNQGDLTGAGHRDDWFRGYVAWVLHGHISAGTAAGRLDVLGSHIRFIPEWFAAEVDSECAVRIAPENLLKGDLVDDTGIIKATITVGEGDRAGAAQPLGDLGNPLRSPLREWSATRSVRGRW